MKTILITGANGFLGTNLKKYFSKNYHVLALGRDSLDVTDKKSVDDWFFKNKVDYVIHAAVKGGKRTDPDSFEQLVDNLTMYKNLVTHKDKFSAMFTFGSGAEFDRRKNIDKVTEEKVTECYPQDFYGLAKKLITCNVVLLDSNIYNFRLFGCYGDREPESRLIKNLVKGIKNQNIVKIDGTKEMDFFYVEDVGRAVEFYINNQKDFLPKDVNLVYKQKYTLEQISLMVEEFYQQKNSNLSINNSQVFNYTGCADTCNDTFPESLFVGFESGLKKYLEKMNEQ